MSIAVVVALLGAWFGHANPVSHLPGVALLFPSTLLWLGLQTDSPCKAFRQGWICGSLTYAACLYWIFLPVHVHGGLHWILALPCPVLVGMYLGLFAGVFSGLICWMRSQLPWYVLAVAAGLLWGSLEMAQGTFFSGFSWLTLPAAMAPWPLLIQPMAWVGEYWQSVLFMTCAAWLTMAIRSRICLALGLAGCAGLLALGVVLVNKPLPAGEQIQATLVQGNIDQTQKWEPAHQEATVRAYIDLTTKELHSRPDLVIWPETALPFYLQEDKTLSRQVRAFVKRNKLLLLTGSPRYRVDLSTGAILYANSAFLLDPKGKTLDAYDKEHLVPFGEYVPLSSVFPFISRLAHSEGEFLPGTSPRPLRFNQLALGILICYEAIFPELSQERVRAGANLLVNISNDAWFGRSSAPRQHLHQAVLRAVEQGRYLLRATNSGITAVIDPRGRRLESGTLFQKLTLTYSDARLLEETTFFHRHFDLLQAALPALTAIFILLTWLLRSFRARRGATGHHGAT